MTNWPIVSFMKISLLKLTQTPLVWNFSNWAPGKVVSLAYIPWECVGNAKPVNSCWTWTSSVLAAATSWLAASWNWKICKIGWTGIIQQSLYKQFRDCLEDLDDLIKGMVCCLFTWISRISSALPATGSCSNFSAYLITSSPWIQTDAYFQCLSSSSLKGIISKLTWM